MSPPDTASPVAPLRFPGFRALWGASVFSNLGTFLQSSAAAWLMLELTGSATWVGLMSASTTLPFLVLALLAGAVADLVERVKVLLLSQIVMGLAAAAMAVITFLGEASPGRLLLLGMVIGVAAAFNLPAWQALVPDLVPREMVASAVALNSVAFNVARAVGPALGGLLVATVGAEAGFGLNSLSYLAVILVLVAMRRSAQAPPVSDPTSLSNAIALGIRFARYTRAFRRLLMFGALFALTSAVVPTILPNHTQNLGGGSLAFGVLLGTMGVGAIAAAFVRGRVVDRLGAKAVAITMAGYGAAGVGVGLAPSLAWTVPFLVLAGACLVWTTTTLNSTAQLLSPPWVRGRTMSLWSLAFAGVSPLGAILAGTAADATTTRTAYVALSLAGVALGAAALRSGIPPLTEVVPPEFSGVARPPAHVDTLDSGPVMIINTFQIRHQDLDDFVAVMNDLRLVRLRTGAYRWRLYRDAADPGRLYEVFLTVSWQEHLNQHHRIDDASAVLITRARSFDQRGDPTSRHLLAV
ncbi:MAG TPA: MFS transporter, partial [Acidimicrobiia bacterium]|nr:MFS transporter [Acidimicrobiia bacterium]